MLQSLLPLLPTVGHSDGGARHSRHGRSRRRPHTYGESGKIIWSASAGGLRNYYLYARKSFELAAEPSEAFLKITADSAYKVFVNGHYVGKGPVRSPHGILYFDEYDINGHLSSGSNVIAVLVHHLGEHTFSHIHRAPGLLCKAEIITGGDTATIVTDESWKVRRADDWTDAGDRQSFRLGFQEVYDASKRQHGWDTVKFNDKAWQPAVVVGTPPGGPWGDLAPREIPFLREETLLPKAVVGAYNSPERPRTVTVAEMPGMMAASELTQLRAGSVQDIDKLLTPNGQAVIKTPRGDRGVAVIVDFGKEVFGNVEIGIADSGLGCIDIGYSELLEDGRVKPNKAETKYADRVLLHKDRLDWQSFSPRGFRYVQLEFRWCSRPVALEYVRVNSSLYPAGLTATFDCSDGLLNDIWKTSVYTTRLCMEDTYLDCPWRERAQWWADARLESRTAFYAFSDTALLAQGLRQIAQSQRPDGAVMGMYPAGEEQMLPDFSLIWIFSLLDYYGFSDDVGLLRELYPNVRRLLEWFAGFEGEFGLLTDVPGWVFIDWGEIDKRGQCTALNCLYYQGVRVGALIAELAGSPDEAAALSERADALRRSINKYLYSPRRGLYADGRHNGEILEQFSRQTNIWAALFDIADHYQKRTICRLMLNGGLPAIQTPYFTSYFLEALYANDLHDEALEIIRDRWGAMLKAGATTFWEMFDTNNSLCHGWAGGPARDLLAEVVGIKPVLGAHRFIVAPHASGLRWARGSVETASGRLSVDWRVLRGSFDMTVTVPDGLRVDVYAPGPAHDTRITVNGKHWPSRFISVGPGAHHVRATQVKPAKADSAESLKRAEVPHVEVLDEVSQRGRRLEPLRMRGRGRIDRRRASVASDEPVLSAAEMLESGITAEVEAEEPAVAAGVSADAGHVEPGTGTTRKPRRRGGRGRSRKEPSSAPAGSTADVGVVPAAEDVSEGARVAEVAPAETGDAVQGQDATAPSTAPASRPRSRRRGGRGRGRRQPADSASSTEASAPAEPAEAAHTVEAEPVSVEQPVSAPGEAAASTGPEHKPRSRRRGSRGRGRRHSAAAGSSNAPDAASEPAATDHSAAPAAEAPIAPQDETHSAPESGADGEEKPRRRRPYSRRGGSRRRKPAEGTGGSGDGGSQGVPAPQEP